MAEVRRPTRQTVRLFRAVAAVEQDIADQKLEVDSLKADMERGQAQIEAIKARFDADKKRYLELSQR